MTQQMSMTNESNVVKKPMVIIRHSNDITVSWIDVFEAKKDGTYVLQIFDEFKCWKTVYWGNKTQFMVHGMAPCTCYNFRLREEGSDRWLEFKGATDDGPYYVLHVTRALRLGKAALLRKIAQKRPNLLEMGNKENKTPLMQSIERGDIQTVTLLISLGANVNTPMIYVRRTPLILAVYLGQLQIAAILLNKGADVKATDINGLNILHYAVDANRINSVQFALDHGVNVKDVDNKGWSPLMRAGEIFSGTAVNLIFKDGLRSLTILFFCAYLHCITAILKSTEEIVKLLIQYGANIEQKDTNGFDFDKHCEMGRINYNFQRK